MKFGECIESYPFLGMWIEKSGNFYIRESGGQEYRAQLRNADLSPKFAAVIFAKSTNKPPEILKWMPISDLFGSESLPRNQGEYRKIREKHFGNLSGEELACFLSKAASDEDGDFLEGICREKLQPLSILSKEFALLVKSMAKSVWVDTETVEDVIKEKIGSTPSGQLVELHAVLQRLHVDSLKFEIFPAFKWFEQPCLNDIKVKAAQTVFSQDQLIDRILRVWDRELAWNLMWKIHPEHFNIANVLEKIISRERELTPYAMEQLRSFLRNDSIPKSVLNARCRRFNLSLDELTQLGSREDEAIRILLEGKKYNQLLKDCAELTQEQALEVCRGMALALDLEANEKSIGQVGWVFGTEKFSAEKREEVQDLLKILRVRLSEADLIVGHNILDWDMPILANHGCKVPAKTPVWDTLLISFLLEPWKASHALGGAHTALDDAQECRELFLKQVETIGTDKVLGVLREVQGKGNAAFYRAVCHQIPRFKAPDLPEWFDADWKRIAVPEAWLDDIIWRKNVAVGESSGFLDFSLLDELEQNETPKTIVLATVMRGAKEADVILHEDLIPLWMKGDKEKNDAVNDFLEASRSSKIRDDAKWRVQPLHSLKYSEFKKLDAIAAEANEELFLNREYTHAFPEEMDCLHPIGSKLLRISTKTKSDNSQWAQHDPLEAPSCKRMNLWQVHEKDAISFPDQSVVAKSNTTIIKWSQDLLYPGSQQMQSYWLEALARFKVVSESINGKGTVPLFVVVSARKYSRLMVMIEEAFAELDWLPNLKNYHSWSRRLQLASPEGRCLFGHVSDIHRWLALGKSLGIRIVPVFESLPLEEWYIISDGDGQLYESEEEEPDPVSDAVDEEGPSEGDEPGCNPQTEKNTIPVWALLEKASQLVASHFLPWLILQTGDMKEDDGFECWITDPRVPPSKTLGKEFNFQELQLCPLDLENIHDCFSDLAPPPYQEPSTDMEDLRTFTEKWFLKEGKFQFKNYQCDPVQRVLERKEDILVRLPTGMGKSLIFQAPALYRSSKTGRLTLVISPLRALMHDQVKSLHEKNVVDEVEYLSADRPWYQSNAVYQGVLEGRVRLIYVAPERFRSQRFIQVLGNRIQRDGSLEFVVFDEAHCISLWGHEFRPDYLYAARKLSELRNLLQHSEVVIGGGRSVESFPMICLSATVPEKVREEMEDALGGYPLTPPPVKEEDPVREDIEVHPEPVKGSIHDWKSAQWDMKSRLDSFYKTIRQANRESAAIIFTRRRLHASELAALLQDKLEQDKAEQPVRVEYYHAGLNAEDRKDIYEAYKKGDIQVLVATKAFGMGMDIPHIHQAVHLSPPNYLEDYLQEIGRIGRNKEMMKKAGFERLGAYLLYNASDFEDIRVKAQKSRISFDDISNLWADMLEKAQGASRVMFPGHNDKERMCLHWLEENGKLTIDRLVPAALEIRVNEAQLEQSATNQEMSPEERLLAKELLSIWRSESGNSVQRDDSTEVGVFSKLVSGFMNLFGFGVPKSNKPPGENGARKSKSGNGTSQVISLLELSERTRSGTDEVLQTITEIDGVTLDRQITFDQDKIAKNVLAETSRLLKWYGNKCASVLLACKGKKKEPINWEDFGISLPVISIKDATTGENKDYPEARQRMESCLVDLVRICGGKVENSPEDRSIKLLTLSSTRYEKRHEQVERIANLMVHVWQLIKKFSDGKSTVSLLDLIEKCGTRFSKWELEKALFLIDKLQLAKANDQLLPTAYQITLKDTSEFSEDRRKKITARLKDQEELAELRCHAMEVFAHLEGEPGRDFIRGYFRQSSTKQLKDFLIEILGSQKASWAIDKIAQINKQAFETMFREKYNPDYPDDLTQESTVPEPMQWKAIKHPYNQHLLVNAGPGAGKTGVLLARVVHLIHDQKLQPEQILVLAFNRAVVHEIRTRVQKIFKEVGLGGFDAGLSVSTFHALAAKHVNRSEPFDPKDLLEVFAQQLKQNNALARKITGKRRAILVDEFQDMNDALFDILLNIQKASDGAGVFAIGDDDQDILSWNRKPKGKTCDKYFTEFMSQLKSTSTLTFKINFRSTKDIVDRSQQKIATWVPKGRKREVTLKPLPDREEGSVKEYTVTSPEDSSIKTLVIEELIKAKQVGQSSIAILCRTNAEVANWHERLKNDYSELKIQGGANYRVAQLRHVALWLDILKEYETNSLCDGDFRDTLFNQWLMPDKDKDIPEAREARYLDNPEKSEFYRQLCNLWDWCLEDNPDAKAEDLIEFVNDLNTDDYGRMQEQRSLEKKGFQAVISTVHKVKGLEFDCVVVLPSKAPFPFSSGRDFSFESEAEAKTYYVAMTRAKSRLVCFDGERENCWREKKQYLATTGQREGMLCGEPKEFLISWAGFNVIRRAWTQGMEKKVSGNAMQKGIMRYIAVGDRVTIWGRRLIWPEKDCQIGLLARVPGNISECVVSAVLRYPQSKHSDYFKRNPDEFEKLTESVKDQGCLWLVCVQSSSESGGAE